MAVDSRFAPSGITTGVSPGEKSETASTSGADEEQQPLQRHVLAERHQVHLAVDAGGLPRPGSSRNAELKNARGRARARTGRCRTAARRRVSRASWRIAGVAAGVVLEQERRRRLRPDHERRAALPRPARVSARYVSRMPAARALVPLLVLRDVALHERHADGLARRGPARRRCTRHCAPGGEPRQPAHAAADRRQPPLAAPPGDRERQRRPTRARPGPTGRRRRRGSPSGRLASRRPGCSRAAPTGSRRERTGAAVRWPPRRPGASQQRLPAEAPAHARDAARRTSAGNSAR